MSLIYKTESPIKAKFAVFGVLVAFLPSFVLIFNFISKNINAIDYIPAVIGIPCAAIGSYFIVNIFVRPIKLILSDEPYLIKEHYKASSIIFELLQFIFPFFLWLITFLALVFSLRLMWPKHFTQALTNTTKQIDLEDKDIVDVILVQINDVYEISTLDNGKIGGLSRVATLIKQLKEKYKNVYTLLAGDFLSPSAMGTLKYNGQNLNGIQMIEVLNKVPVDLVTFGNHEFDIKKDSALQESINKSTFDWVSANVRLKKTNARFVQSKNGTTDSIPDYIIHTFKNENDGIFKMGIIGLTIPSDVDSGYINYLDTITTLKKELPDLIDKSNAIIALTHLDRKQDNSLAYQFPEINLFIGGHEHVNSFDVIKHSPDKTSYVAKADANVRSVYIHHLRYNTTAKSLTISSDLQKIDNNIAEDKDVKEIVDKWNNWAHNEWVKQGLSPCEVLTDLPPYGSLDGTEASVRFRSTNFTDIIARAIYEVCNGYHVNASIFNSGSIRLDDSIKTRVTVYDLIRTLPYGGKIWIGDVKGDVLKKLLDTGEVYKGNGCFLQYCNISKRGFSWYINDTVLDPAKKYRLALNDYLASGKQENMKFFSATNGTINNVDSNTKGTKRDSLTNVVSDYIKRIYPRSTTKAGNIVPCY